MEKSFVTGKGQRDYLQFVMTIIITILLGGGGQTPYKLSNGDIPKKTFKATRKTLKKRKKQILSEVCF